MNATIEPKIYTLQEYLNKKTYDDCSYELEAGIIREMPPESPENVRIALHLMMLIIQKLGISRVSNKAEIIISGSRVNSRVPDVTVFSEAGAVELNQMGRSTITLDMLPPMLAIEVVSPGKANRDSGYRYKRSEYAAKGIANYWIVDPQDKKFLALSLVDGLYEEEVYDLGGRGRSFVEPFDLEVEFKHLC